MARTLEIELPEKLQPLLQPARFKILHGGRGGAKSWSVARVLAATAAFRTQRILCAREIQRSLRESVHQLLKDQIKALELGAYLTPLESEIRGTRNDSLFIYTGLQAHTAMSIKSYEGVDKVWIEEAQAMPKRSWDILEPTIRKAGSEIWMTANLDLESDFFTQLVRDPPPGAVVIEVNYYDNPWFTAELEATRARAEQTMDPEDYGHIWLGKAIGKVKGNIFGNQMQALRRLGRIGPVDPVLRRPLNAFLDLGSSTGNATVVWLHQQVGTRHLFLRHFSAEGQGLRHFWDQMDTWRRAHKLRWGTIYLPHDGAANLQHADLVNRVELMESFAKEDDVPVTVKAVPRPSNKGMAIEVTRERMLDCMFDQRGCADGIQGLDHYKYKWNEEEQRFSREPHHDWASNHADAFMQWATGYEPEEVLPDDRGNDLTPYRGDGGYVRGAY